MPETHAAPLFRHVRQPETPLVCGLAHLDDAFDEALAIVFVDALLDWTHDCVDEGARLVPDLFELRREAEIDGHDGSRPAP